MKIRLVYLFSLSVTLVLTACSDDDDIIVDTQAPVIEINNPTEGQAISPGSVIHFDADFTDNVELSSYKIDVHNAFDGHSHQTRTMAVSSGDDSQDNPWNYNEVFSIESGQDNFHAHEHISIPTEINGQPVSQGHYHFGVFLTDAAGNESQAFLEIHIEEGHGDHDHDHDH